MASIEHRTQGGAERWRVVWRQDVAGVRRKQQMTFPDELQAVRFRKLVEGQPSGDAWPSGWEPVTPGPGAALTFGAWARTAVDARSRANERTKADYRRDLERHFALLEHVPLAELDTSHVARWEKDRRSTCTRCGHSAKHKDGGCTAADCSCKTSRTPSDKTIRNLHGFGSSVMADALSQHPPIAAHNPFANRLATAVSVRTEEMVFFTPPEFALIMRHVPDERGYRELLRTLYGMGPRFGEATALEVRDVDLLGKRKTLAVTKAWKRTGPSGYVRGEPKTRNARRTLSVASSMVDVLLPLIAGRRGDELIFPGPGGGRLSHTEVYKRAWAPAVARANVCDRHYADQRDGRGKPPRLPAPCDCPGVLGKRPRIHDIRHSWVANQISEGVRLEVISRRAGHSSITITMDRYGHLDPSFDDQVDAAVDRALARR